MTHISTVFSNTSVFLFGQIYLETSLYWEDAYYVLVIFDCITIVMFPNNFVLADLCACPYGFGLFLLDKSFVERIIWKIHFENDPCVLQIYDSWKHIIGQLFLKVSFRKSSVLWKDQYVDIYVKQPMCLRDNLLSIWAGCVVFVFKGLFVFSFYMCLDNLCFVHVFFVEIFSTGQIHV